MNFISFLLAGYVFFGQPFVSPIAKGGDIGGQIDKTDLRVCCEKIIRDGPHIWFLSDRNGKMKLQVRGIYIHGSALFFLLRLTNRSSGDYSIDEIRFRAVDKDGGQIAGRAPLEPVFVYDSTKMVPAFGKTTGIFVFPRFTMPAGGRLWIDVRESNGSRHLHIPVGNWMLARARLI